MQSEVQEQFRVDPMPETSTHSRGISQNASSGDSGSDSDDELCCTQLDTLRNLADDLDSCESDSDSTTDAQNTAGANDVIDMKGNSSATTAARSSSPGAAGQSESAEKSDKKAPGENTVEYFSLSDSSDDEYRPKRRPKKNWKREKNIRLSTILGYGLVPKEVYTDANPGKPDSKKTLLDSVATATTNELMKKSVLTSDVEKKHTLPCYQESLRAARKKRQQERANSKGQNWFDMKAPEMTEEQKNDLSVLQMRHVLDPKAFYKQNDFKVLPKFFQMGKVVEHAADFYNSRVPKKQRKQTLVDELLADAEFRKRNKKKYAEAIQAKSAYRGRLKFAKKMKMKRKR